MSWPTTSEDGDADDHSGIVVALHFRVPDGENLGKWKDQKAFWT